MDVFIVKMYCQLLYSITGVYGHKMHAYSARLEKQLEMFLINVKFKQIFLNWNALFIVRLYG